jgi:hypothetical protein
MSHKQKLSQMPDGDKTFKKIREVLHPTSEIVRCDRCKKTIRIFIGDERICGGCNE